MSISKLDAWAVYEEGASYTPPTGISARRLVVLAACAEHTVTGTHTLANSITLGTTAATFIARRSGWISGVIRLGVNLFAIPEASIAAGSQVLSVSWGQTGADNTFLFIGTLDGVDQTTWTDDTTVGFGSIEGSQYPSWTLDTNTADGLGACFMIASQPTLPWSFTVQDGWAERLDVGNSSVNRAYAADKAVTGASTTVAITCTTGAWTFVAAAFKPYVAPGGSNIAVLAAANLMARNQ